VSYHSDQGQIMKACPTVLQLTLMTRNSSTQISKLMLPLLPAILANWNACWFM